MNNRLRIFFAVFVLVLTLASVIFLVLQIQTPPRPPQTLEIIWSNHCDGRILEPLPQETFAGKPPAPLPRILQTMKSLRDPDAKKMQIFLDGGNSIAGDEDISRLLGARPAFDAMYQLPYHGILVNEQEYLLGVSPLSKLLKDRYVLLGMNCTPANPYILLQNVCSKREYKMGDIKVAVFGYFEPPEDMEELKNKYPEMKFEKNIDYIKASMGSTDADVYILLISHPQLDKIAPRLARADLIIPVEFNYYFLGDQMLNIQGAKVAPWIDSRFHIGRVTLSRQKQGDKLWKASSEILPVSQVGGQKPAVGGTDTPLESNIESPAPEDHKLAESIKKAIALVNKQYNNNYATIYYKFVLWVPENNRQDIQPTLSQIYGNALIDFTHAGMSVTDTTKITPPAGSLWGFKEILNIPGQEDLIIIGRAEKTVIEELKSQNPRLTVTEKDQNTGVNPLVVIPSLIAKEYNITLEDPKEIPLSGNLILMDYFKNNRGKIYIKLTNLQNEEAKSALIDMDNRQFVSASHKLNRIIQDKDKTPTQDKDKTGLIMMLGLCQFKWGNPYNAAKIWDQAMKLSSHNQEIKSLTLLLPLQSPKIRDKKESQAPKRNTGSKKIKIPKPPKKTK